jgi:hypothetical protein
MYICRKISTFGNFKISTEVNLSLQLFHCADISIEIPNVFAIRTRHDIAEILLKLALITNQSINQSFGNKDFCLIFYIFLEIDIKCNTQNTLILKIQNHGSKKADGQIDESLLIQTYQDLTYFVPIDIFTSSI